MTAIYFGVQLVALGTFPGIAESSTPLADAAAGFLGSWAGWVMTIGATLSILGTKSNTVLAGPRYLYALAKDGYGPAFLSRVHPRYRTPAAAIILQSSVALPLALTGSFVELAALSVVARLSTYLGTAAAVPVLRRKLPASAVRLPGGFAIPLAAAVLSIGLAASAGLRNLLAAAAALLIGAAIYGLRRRTG